MTVLTGLFAVSGVGQQWQAPPPTSLQSQVLPGESASPQVSTNLSNREPHPLLYSTLLYWVESWTESHLTTTSQCSKALGKRHSKFVLSSKIKSLDIKNLLIRFLSSLGDINSIYLCLGCKGKLNLSPPPSTSYKNFLSLEITH